ncbi:MAG: aspartate/glutamate racemase family protein [Bacteroidales bacterium]|nr:aspartate/glutamate racemase family protein [Bacteroidales bacterium]
MAHKFSLLLLLLFFSFGCHPYGTRYGGDLIRERNIRIVVTDSGLGGLAVMDDFIRKVEASNYYRKAEFIFVNALFDAETGYNSLPSRVEKVGMFNRVLNSIDNNYNPDAIVIACNTLSVLLEGNENLKNISAPVIGIVEPGVDLIHMNLMEDEASTVLIFGTETTIEEASHIRALRQRNIPEERMIAQACPDLQSYIEQNPQGEETEMLISYYVQEATKHMPRDTGPLLVSLNCSHFGYAGDLWRKAAESAGFELVEIINPNNAMSNMLIINNGSNTGINPEISVKVVTMVEIRNVEPVSGLFEKSSPVIADALRNYSLIPGLF